jgi:hypothetical protein
MPSKTDWGNFTARGALLVPSDLLASTTTTGPDSEPNRTEAGLPSTASQSLSCRSRTVKAGESAIAGRYPT